MTDAVERAAAKRLGALRRFALSLTVFNILGHLLLGFEQSYAQPVVAVLTAYAMDLGLEAIDSRLNGRRAAFAGGPGRLVDFLLPAHITGLAVAMLLYANDSLAVVAFATALAVASKNVLRVRMERGTRHFLNPSNFGISATLLLLPWVGIAPPYHFTENISGPLNWALPLVLLSFGTLLNWRFTDRIPLLAAWAAGFALQAVVRHLVFGTYLLAALAPMTSLVFVLYTFYMVTDPATTPARVPRQVLFGASVAAVYGVLVAVHVVFGLFFALTIVCASRGLLIWSAALLRERRSARRALPAPSPSLSVGP
jgi:hypothetical protein